MTPAEGIEFRVEVMGDTPLDAIRKADRLAHNLVADWPTDWPVEFDTAYLQRLDSGAWRATLTGHAVDDTPPMTLREAANR